MLNEIIIHTDGGSRGNPGPAAIGFTIHDAKGTLLMEHCERIGQKTNNEAEYKALIVALEAAQKHYESAKVSIIADSELMISQLKGVYKVRSADLMPLYTQTIKLLKNFKTVQFNHVRREYNKEADLLVNKALDGNAVSTKYDANTDQKTLKLKEVPPKAMLTEDLRSYIPAGADKRYTGIIFDVYQWHQKTFKGSMVEYEKATRSDSVCVIPVTKDGQIIVTEQEQPSYLPFLSVAGGLIDKNELPEQAAARELLEETGYTFEKIELLEKMSFPFQLVWTSYIYIAHGCSKIQNQNLDDGEKINVKLVSFEEFISVLGQDNFREAEVALAIFKRLLNPKEKDKITNLLSK